MSWYYGQIRVDDVVDDCIIFLFLEKKIKNLRSSFIQLNAENVILLSAVASPPVMCQKKGKMKEGIQRRSDVKPRDKNAGNTPG